MVTLKTFDTQLGIVYSKHASGALGKDYWIVKKEFKVEIDGDPNKFVIIPKGFLTDGASVPRLFWSLLPPWGSYGQAVVLHDYLVESLSYDDNGSKITIERKHADRIFNNAMQELGVNDLTRKAMYNAVRGYSKLVPFLKTTSYRKKWNLEIEILSLFERTGIWI